MSAQPRHDSYDEPFWQVQGVYDPDGDKPDFSYTIGLHQRGLPELHLWAQPDSGDDPGADWKLSANDRGHLLNELADLALHGRLGVGTEIERSYDAGLTTLRFRVGEPGDREVLETFGIAPDASVLPVRWSLHRAPERPRSGMSADAERAAAAAYRELRDGLVDRRPAPRGWSLPPAPSFAPDQRYGPRTPVVLARAAQLWQADEETLVDLLDAAILVESAGFSLSYPTAVAGAVAREVGRTQCLSELHEDVHGLLDQLTSGRESRAGWRRVVRTFDEEGWSSAGPSERGRMTHRAASLLHDLVMMCLSVEAVADVADADLLREARGPWLTGLHGGDPVPGEEWHAAPQVLHAVGELLAPLDLETLGIVAGAHDLAQTRGIREAPRYAELAGRLVGSALVSPAGCPWDPTLSTLPGWRPLLDAVPHGVIAPLLPLQHWATCVTSALTHRARLTADDVRTLAAPFRQDLPLLEQRLNAPL